jgi:hypothetical protein
MYGRGIISHLTCAIIPKSGARRAEASAPPPGETICAWSRCMSEIRVHFSDSALEAPLTGLPSDIAESCDLFRMAIKNLNQANRSFTGLHNVPRSYFWNARTSAANDPTRLFLGEAKLLAHGLDPCGIGHAQFPIGAFYGLQIFAGVDRNRYRRPDTNLRHRDLATKTPRKPSVRGRNAAGVCRYQGEFAFGHESQIHLYGCFRLLKFEMRLWPRFVPLRSSLQQRRIIHI